MSRTRATDETCAECERHVAPHQGPAAPAEFEYLVREIAGALVDVGRGNTYTDVAKRVRMRANIGKTARYRDVESGQTVAEWMADFVPVVAARHEPTEWPAVLVLDSISFRWTDPTDSKNHTLYAILAAYGYDENGRHGRLWKVEAVPTANGRAWAKFLSALPGTPLSIVCDQGQDIHGGIRAHWGDETFDRIVHLCEYHLGDNVKDALERDRFTPSDDIWKLYRRAFTSRAGWEAFEVAVDELPAAQFLKKWTKRQAPALRVQTARRAEIPPVYSNGALETALGQIRGTIAPRAFSYRNRARTNQMLALYRLALIRADDVLSYTTDIRTHIIDHHGHPPRVYRDIYDPGEGGSSLWSKTTQRKMKEARRDAPPPAVVLGGRSTPW